MGIIHNDETHICFECEAGNHGSCLLADCDCEDEKDIEGV